MKILSIDLETTGLDPETCDIVEFAAILSDIQNGEIGYFRRCLLPPVDRKYYRGEATALGWHSALFKEISGETSGDVIPLEELGKQLSVWLTKMNAPRKITPAGKNFSSFDLSFLLKVPNFENFVCLERKGDNGASFLLRKRCFDPGVYFFDSMRDDCIPDTRKCLERAGINSESKHTALEDARIVVQLIEVGLRKIH